MWSRDDMARINAHVDPHDLEEEVYDLASGEVAKVERLYDASGDAGYIIYYWPSRRAYDIDQYGLAQWPANHTGHENCTVSMAFDSYMDAAEQIEHDAKKEN